MIKTYPAGKNIKLSEHFDLSEFRCKCGGAHETLVDDELIDKLEMIFDSLDCSKILVNSGHRCSSHDKRVGGTGVGQHINGTAADIVCYDKKGKIIPSTEVCCAAQDAGFNGIANIDSTYTATHVDTRKAGKWYGDETITTTTSITDDFHKLYGETKVMKDVTLIIDGVTYTGTLTAK